MRKGGESEVVWWNSPGYPNEYSSPLWSWPSHYLEDKGKPTNDVRYSQLALGCLWAALLPKKKKKNHQKVTKRHWKDGPFLASDFYPNLWFKMSCYRSSMLQKWHNGFSDVSGALGHRFNHGVQNNGLKFWWFCSCNVGHQLWLGSDSWPKNFHRPWCGQKRNNMV